MSSVKIMLATTALALGTNLPEVAVADSGFAKQHSRLLARGHGKSAGTAREELVEAITARTQQFGKARLLGGGGKQSCKTSGWGPWKIHGPHQQMSDEIPLLSDASEYHCYRKTSKDGSEKWCSEARVTTIQRKSANGGTVCPWNDNGGGYYGSPWNFPLGEVWQYRKCSGEYKQKYCDIITSRSNEIDRLNDELKNCGKPVKCASAGVNVDVADVPWWVSRGKDGKAWTAKDLVKYQGALYEAQWWTTSKPSLDNVGPAGPETHGKEWHCVCKLRDDATGVCPGA